MSRPWGLGSATARPMMIGPEGAPGDGPAARRVAGTADVPGLDARSGHTGAMAAGAGR